MLLAIAVNQGLDIIHADIPQAFLELCWTPTFGSSSHLESHSKTKMARYVKLKVVKLIRSLYGLRDSLSNFNKELVRFMKAASVGQLESDKCIFNHIDKNTEKFVLVGREVDDLIVTGNDASLIYCRCDNRSGNELTRLSRTMTSSGNTDSS